MRAGGGKMKGLEGCCMEDIYWTEISLNSNMYIISARFCFEIKVWRSV